MRVGFERDRIVGLARGKEDARDREVDDRSDERDREADAELLERARVKAPQLRFEWGDALSLGYPDDSFDAVTVGFGARNFGDLGQGLREMVRVTRPGGRVVVLEITTPQRPPLSLFFRLWFDRLVPLIGRVAGDPEAYSYLPNSVRRFPDARGLAAAMSAVGLVDVRWVLTAGGIIAIHAGTVEA